MTPARTPLLRKITQNTAPSELLGLTTAGIWACDFYVTGAERGAAIPGGYRMGRVSNIDHHAPTDRMPRRVWSDTLARLQVLAEGLPATEDLIVVNHTDCDSVLSTGIMPGRLEPLEECSDAMRLNRLGIESFDAAYGGRWNAGSNKRGDGTTTSPDAYARAL